MAQYEKQTTNDKWDIDNTHEGHDSRIPRYCSKSRFGSNVLSFLSIQVGTMGDDEDFKSESLTTQTIKGPFSLYNYLKLMAYTQSQL